MLEEGHSALLPKLAEPLVAFARRLEQRASTVT
jgi:hypothetical protein